MDPDAENEVDEGDEPVLGGFLNPDLALADPPEIVLFYALDSDLNVYGTDCELRMFKFIYSVEKKFQYFGERVAQNPKMCISFALLFVIAMMFGFLCFRQERNPLNLWIPKQSDFYSDTNWIMNKYGEGLRAQYVLITAPDVLQPHVMLQLLDIHSKLVNLSATSSSWQNVCFKVPVISFNLAEPRFRRDLKESGGGFSEEFDAAFNQSFFKDSAKNSVFKKSTSPSMQDMMTDETFDPSVLLGSSLYCSIVKNFPLDCLQENILDLWKYDYDVVKNLTKEKIVRDINNITFSPTLGHPIPFKSLLGGITYDENGRISSARALLTIYMVHVNFSTVNMDEVGNEGGTADWANGPGLDWESKFLEIMHEAANSSAGIEVYYEAGRSFGDISASGMFQDMDKLMIGIALMLVYIQLQQTKLSCVESRIIPTMVGLLCVGLSFLSSVGFCSLLGIPYGPVHTSLPFLLMGLGVDDMFVILSCWNALPSEEKTSPIPKRMGLAMRHAGLSITVTSITDFVAFLIGSTTILPSLRSFCLYAAVGVFVTYVLQATVFVAALTLDQKRMDVGRNCLIPFIRQAVPKEPDTKRISHCSKVLQFIYTHIVFHKVGRYFILVATGLFMSFSFVGNLNIKQEFRPEWFIDKHSYLSKFLEERDVFFPGFGNSGSVFLGQLHYSEELQNIGRLIQNLHDQNNTLQTVEDWWGGFHRYVNAHFSKDIKVDVLSDEEFNQYISQYLFSPPGARFQKNFRFSNTLECGKPAPNITVASIDFFFNKFGGSEESVKAMNILKDLVMNANFTTGDKFATVWAKVFANWVTDEVIANELIRNIALAMISVGITTFILLGHVYSSILVLLCVSLTLINTTGMMFYWNMTIDLVSAIALVLAVGLCVDFAAHIMYAFMSIEGSRETRALHAVSYIGGAVLHGGVTTLLSLSVLVFSKSYIFTAFFKIFLLIILLGLWHGLVFLPVILSMIGPMPYSSYKKKRPNMDNSIHIVEAEEDIGENIPTPPERPAVEDGRGL